VKRIPWWAVASATTAPLILGAGLVLAQARQPPGYSAVSDTISALAAQGATDRWVMTTALAGLGASHFVTALGLGPARRAGRIVLGAGGVATVAVAMFAQPAHGNSVGHTVSATVAFVALAAWPLGATAPEAEALLLRWPASLIASAVLLGSVIWFAAEIHGGHRGLAERTAAGLEALWPLALVLTTRRARTRVAT
jgi:hypothetical membrane protein